MGKRVINRAAHGNSLRALVKYLDHISMTRSPIEYPYRLYRWSMNWIENMSPIRHYYLGDQEAVQNAIMRWRTRPRKNRINPFM
jgi:2,3-bisphosphoglycerate-dependent phosphoglycerate mutase